MAFLPGEHAATKYLPDGTALISTSFSVSHRQRLSAYALAIINGAPHVLIGEGGLAGYWLPVTATSDGPERAHCGPTPLRVSTQHAARSHLGFTRGDRLNAARVLIALGGSCRSTRYEGIHETAD
ncbi:MAG: hypothetical protein M3406_10670 [Chloroflexota bacterium]|nr:hypothetical protein [Chloroflexota bacterium]